MENTSTNLKRTDITTVNSTNKGCIKILPQTKKSHKQKVVIGDNSGVVSSFSVGKSLDIKTEFSNAPLTKPIFRLALHDDQIFAASGSSVSAMTRKGKSFFTLETNMTEDIRFLSARSPYLYIGGQYTVTAFQESSERGFYMSPDKINDLDLDPVVSEGPASAAVVLACQDRTVRRVHHGNVTAEVSCEAPVSAIHFEKFNFGKNPNKQQTSESSLIYYGTLGGTISCVSKKGNDKLENVWTQYMNNNSENNNNSCSSSAITAIGRCDFSKSGILDVVVAREDGTVEVFQENSNSSVSGNNSSNAAAAASSSSPDVENNNGNLTKIFTSSFGEYISGLDTGCVTTGDKEDVVVSTFSGKVVALSAPSETDLIIPTTAGSYSAMNQISAVNPNTVSDDTSILPQATSLKIEATQKEIQTLQTKIAETKTQLGHVQSQIQVKQSKTQPSVAQLFPEAPSGSLSIINKTVGGTAGFSVVDRFLLDGEDLKILTELDVPLGAVSVSSEVPLEIVSELSDSCSKCDPCQIISENTFSSLFTNQSGGSGSAGGLSLSQLAEHDHHHHHHSHHEENLSSSMNSASGVAHDSMKQQEQQNPKFLGVFKPGTADSSGLPKKLEIRFKCDEGLFGKVTTTITAAALTSATSSYGAATRTYNIPPLSQHVRMSSNEIPSPPTEITENPQFAKLEIFGAFSLKEVHHWLHSCLMDVPEKIAENTTTITSESSSTTQMHEYHFRNMYIGTILQVTVARGELIAYSQNASTLTILRDHITRHATQRKIAVRMSSDMKPEAVDVVIWLGINIWRNLSNSASQYELLDALKELQSQEGENAERFLSPALKEIVGRSKQLEQESKNHEQDLERLKTFLVAWLSDAVVFSGSPHSSDLEQVKSNFVRLLDAPVSGDSETDLRMYTRDTCFPPPPPPTQ